MLVKKQWPGKEEHVQEETLNFGGLGERENNIRSIVSLRGLKDGFTEQLTQLEAGCKWMEGWMNGWTRLLCRRSSPQLGAWQTADLSSNLLQHEGAGGFGTVQPAAHCSLGAQWWFSCSPGAKTWAVSNWTGCSPRSFNCQGKIFEFFYFVTWEKALKDGLQRQGFSTVQRTLIFTLLSWTKSCRCRFW